MLARYIQFINHNPTAAFLWAAHQGVAHANEQGRDWLEDTVQSETLSAAAAHSASYRQAETHDALRSTFLLLPIVEEDEIVRYVVGIEAGDLADAPLLLHQLHGNARHFSQILHLLPQLVLTAQSDGEFDYASRRWDAVFGNYSSGLSLDSRVHVAAGAHAAEFSRQWRAGIDSGERFSFEIQLCTMRGELWHEVRATPWYDEKRLRKWVATFDDIHKTVQTRQDLVSIRRRLTALSKLGRSLHDMAIAPEDIVRSALDHASNAIEAIWIARFQIGGQSRIVVHPAGARMFERALDESCDSEAAMQTTRQWNDEPPRVVLQAALDVGEPGLQGLALVSGPGAPLFSDLDIEFFSDVALRIGVALRFRAEYGRQERVATALQAAMLPRALPIASGVKFDVAYRPAETQTLVGGDWYDAFELPDGRLAFSIGDVAGHGLNAAVVMGHVRESLRSAAIQGFGPQTALVHANAAVIAADRGLISTFLGYLDPLTLGMEYASAGHAPPFVVTGDGDLQTLAYGNPMLGAMPDFPYEVSVAQLEEDSALVLYTDGLVEFSRDVIAGESRLRNILAAWAEASFTDGAAAILERVLAGEPANDDIAILVVRAPSEARLDATIPALPQHAHRARKAIHRVLSAAKLGPRADDFVLAMGEALSNAIEHGSQSPSDFVHFSVEPVAEGLVGTVSSCRTWLDRTSTPERGRGLLLMQALTDRVKIDSAGKGIKVTLSVGQPSLNEVRRA